MQALRQAPAVFLCFSPCRQTFNSRHDTNVMHDTANYASPETIRRLIANVPRLKIRKWQPEDVQMLFRIMYYSALRPSEAIKLEKKHFDLERREIFLGKTKTRINDKALVPRQFLPDLEDWLSSRPDGRLWPDLQYKTLYRWLIALGKICKVPAFETRQAASHEKTIGHIFRKSMGKDMVAGMYGDRASDVNVVAKHLRHKKPSTTIDSYLKLTLEGVKDAL